MHFNNFLLTILLISTLALTASSSSFYEFEVDERNDFVFDTGSNLESIAEKSTKQEELSRLFGMLSMTKQVNGLIRCTLWVLVENGVSRGFVNDEFSKPFFANISSTGELKSIIIEDTLNVTADVKRHLLTEFYKDRSNMTQLLKSRTIDNDVRVMMPLGLCKPKITFEQIPEINATNIIATANASDCNRVDDEDVVNLSSNTVIIEYWDEVFRGLYITENVNIHRKKSGDWLKGQRYTNIS